MINIKNLMKAAQEIGDSNKIIIPMGLQQYIKECGEDHAVIVVKNDIVDEVVFTDDENESLDLRDAVNEHVEISKGFASADWEFIETEKMYVTWGITVFSYKEI